MQLTAAILRLHLAVAAPTDGLLSVKVISFFKSKLLPFQLRSHGVTEIELREDLEDGIEYKSSNQGKLAIEEKRIHLLGVGYVNAKYTRAGDVVEPPHFFFFCPLTFPPRSEHQPS